MDIRKLVKDGVPISRIAEMLGRDWKTVATAAKQEHSPEYRRGQRASKLDAYKTFIQSKLKEAPYTARRILEMIEAQGYRGGHTIVSDYVASAREKQRVTAVLRFETVPGEQMQVDWAEFGEVIGATRGKQKLYLFCAVLGYSRMRYIEFTVSQRLTMLLDCLRGSLEYFGGVPSEVLFDNMKTVVVGRDLAAGTIQWNERFRDFAGYYGFRPRLTWPYRAQTKGKVERSIGYVRQDFWPGVRFESIADLNRQALDWLDKVNGRVHSETAEIPRERLVRENLRSIACQPRYDNREHSARRASRDCWVSFEGNYYSVPWVQAGKAVTVLAGPECLEIFAHSRKIAEHRRVPAGQGLKITNGSHFEGLRESVIHGHRQRQQSRAPLLSVAQAAVVESRDLSAYEELLPAEVLQ